MPSNVTYTCIPCRFSAKQTHICPYCRETMRNMGKAFKPPRKSNDSQWAKVAMLVDHGQYFGYCSCHRPKFGLQRTLAEVKNKLATRRSARKNYAEVSDVRTKQAQRHITWKGQEYK